MVTSGPALTGVAILKAASEMDKTKSLLLGRLHRQRGLSLDAYARVIRPEQHHRGATVMTKVISVGHGDGVAPLRVWLSRIRSNILSKVMLCPIAATGCRPCMLGNCRFNRH